MKPLFSGIRVLEFCAHYAGPIAARFLADHGAQVIKVESAVFPDNGRVNPAFFNDFSRSKLGAAVNLKTERGRELVRRLVSLSDVVIENYALGVMERLGLDDATLCSLKPDLIIVHMQGLGRSGPWRHYVTLGHTIMALSGLLYAWGQPGDPEPVGSPSPHADYLAAAHAAVAILAALIHRDRTGEGVAIDLSQLEATAAAIGPLYLDYFANRRAAQPKGNTSEDFAPHNTYRCKGDDGWCAITVQTEAQWQALCQVMGNPSWTREPRFATNRGRLDHRQELDQRLEGWTRQHTPHQVMWLLQRAGVPAGAVQTNEDLFFDPHLRQRGFVVEVPLEGEGMVEYAGPTVRLSVDVPTVRRPAPALGEHNAYVFGDLLGLAPEEMAALTAEGVLV